MSELDDFSDMLLRVREASREVRENNKETADKLAKISKLVADQSDKAASRLSNALRSIDAQANSISEDLSLWKIGGFLCLAFALGAFGHAFVGGIMSGDGPERQQLVDSANRLADALAEASWARKEAEEDKRHAVKLLSDQGASKEIVAFLTAHAADLRINHYQDHDTLVVEKVGGNSTCMDGCFIVFPKATKAPYIPKGGQTQRKK